MLHPQITIINEEMKRESFKPPSIKENLLTLNKKNAPSSFKSWRGTSNTSCVLERKIKGKEDNKTRKKMERKLCCCCSGLLCLLKNLHILQKNKISPVLLTGYLPGLDEFWVRLVCDNLLDQYKLRH